MALILQGNSFQILEPLIFVVDKCHARISLKYV